MSAPAIIMAAPNGARRGKADHPALPVSIAEIAAEAARCRAEGAAAIHAHVRDARGAHVLDAGLYREVIAEIAVAAPDMLVQVTTEGVGRYGPQEQAAVVRAVRPEMVSVALREMVPEGAPPAPAARFYAWAEEAGVHVQHILYSAADSARLLTLLEEGIIPAGMTCRLYVLGSHGGRAGVRDDLAQFRRMAATPGPWFLCAFGSEEGACIAEGLRRGGHARVGFENNFMACDGSLAEGTFTLVAEAATAAHVAGRSVATPAQARGVLGLAEQAGPF